MRFMVQEGLRLVFCMCGLAIRLKVVQNRYRGFEILLVELCPRVNKQSAHVKALCGLSTKVGPKPPTLLRCPTNASRPISVAERHTMVAVDFSPRSSHAETSLRRGATARHHLLPPRQ